MKRISERTMNWIRKHMTEKIELTGKITYYKCGEYTLAEHDGEREQWYIKRAHILSLVEQKVLKPSDLELLAKEGYFKIDYEARTITSLPGEDDYNNSAFL